MTSALKLIAMDAEDLSIISAHVQDAIIRPADLIFDRVRQQLILPLRRFVHEDPASRRFLFAWAERRLAVMKISRVTAISSKGFTLPASQEAEPLALLTMTFRENSDAAPAGELELIFATGQEEVEKRMRLQVECVEIHLADTEARWQASSRPRHGSV